MRIDLNTIDRSKFLVEENIIISTGDTIFFVKPDLNAIERDTNPLVWTQENKIFRSSVWVSIGDGQLELICAGFPKFVNWGENPQNFPVPQSLRDAVAVEKLDGSLLIVSRYRGHYFLRTRGTLDATSLKNGAEIEIFKQNILPRLLEYQYDNTWNMSWLFEWTSPTQRIVIDYGNEPRWSLVGCVKHNNYALVPQGHLDKIAKDSGFNRPVTYSFDSIENLLLEVDKWKGKEGVVLYSNKGQTLHKAKSAWYLALHRMKTELASREKVVKVWLQMGKPTYKDFYEKIATQFDFELAERCRGDISIICDAWKEVQIIIDSFKKFIETRLLPLGEPTGKARKEMADIVFSSYGKTSRAGFVFTLLDGKELDDDALEKLLWQCIKNK